MARKDSISKPDRRRFLTGVAAAAAVAPAAALAQSAEVAQTEAPRAPSALPPSAQVAAAETATPGENGESSRINGVPGSDFMVDVIKTLGIKYVPSNCASSYRGIHESLVNYGGNKMPEFLN